MQVSGTQPLHPKHHCSSPRVILVPEPEFARLPKTTSRLLLTHTSFHQPATRRQEVQTLHEKRRKGHVPHISITDDDHHVTEAIGSSYYDDEPMSPPNGTARPLSYISSPEESYESQEQQRKAKRNGSYFEYKPPSPRIPLAATVANEKLPSPAESTTGSPKNVKRMSSLGSENSNGGSTSASPPQLSRQSSSDTAVQSFPLNDIDYESSPAAVAQELSNLQAIRRMSMNVDAADPDLPSFGGGLGGVPTVAPSRSEDENDAARLFWVPARLHPELAPKEFKTFIEERVDKIKRRSGDEDNLSPDTGSPNSLRRKKSMLSHQVDPKGSYEDGAERLERKRSRGLSVEAQTQVELAELETLVNDPAQLIRRLSLDTARRSSDSAIEVPADEDMPVLPPGGQSLKRSTRTAYRRGSLKKGERVPFSKRAQQRHTESETDEPPTPAPARSSADAPTVGLSRVQTEPMPAPSSSRQPYPARTESSLRWRETQGTAQPVEQTVEAPPENKTDQPTSPPLQDEEQTTPRPPQHKHFQSRLASGGRTTAQLPGYDNSNPLPQIVETLPDGTKVPKPALVQNVPERKSSHESPRPIQRGGAHMRPVPGREQRSSTLDDISSRPSPLPGVGNTSTDALTMVPTFDDRKSEKKDSSRKSSWKWILGNDDDEKRNAKEDKDAPTLKSSKSKISKSGGGDKARLDVLQNSIESTPSRGRESLVLNREDVKLEEERKKESKRSTESKKEKDSGLLSAIFGSKKKSSDGDLKEKKRKSDRNISPDPAPRILKPDIDYNWTRFSILEERAIYRMAHIKLANPRRALYSQVLLSNFMYSYLAKVQMMHPQVQIPPAHQKAQQRGKQEEQQQAQQQQQPAEYNQYQRWQEQQQEREAAESNTSTSSASNSAAGLDAAGGGAGQQSQQQRTNHDYDEESSAGYDTRGSEEYDYEHSYQQQQSQSTPTAKAQQHGRTNGVGSGEYGGAARKGSSSNGSGGGGGGYSVSQTHDYLGYAKDQQPFDGGGLWDDDKSSEELW